MKFSSLSIADLASHEIAEIENAAIPAIPAIDVDFKGNSLAIPLLFDAIPLLFENSRQTQPPRIAANSSRIANQELLIPDTNQTDTEIIAGIAKIAASENGESAKEQPEYIDSIKHDTREIPKEALALSILQRLYAEHEQRLIAGGHDGKGALVHGITWTQALKKARIPPDVRFDLLDAGKVSLQGPYWALPTNHLVF